jgi:hypothetical protein
MKLKTLKDSLLLLPNTDVRQQFVQVMDYEWVTHAW